MAESKATERMEKIVSLCKRRGFIFQSSEIYGGINGFWDYGPLGVELKRNLKEAWWRSMTLEREDVVGLDATIIMHPIIWKASGHVETFSDPMVDCLLTNRRFRADQIEPQSGIAYYYSGARDKSAGKESRDPYSVLVAKGKPPESARKTATQFYQLRGIKDPELLGERSEEAQNTQRYNPENGSLLTEARPFNLMFQSHYGPIASDENICYLRPETAQAIFVQFKNVLDSSRQKMPFGIGQIGKAFRNEITPRNFIFRSREFEQMELEFFIPPDEAVAALAGEVATAQGAGHPGEPQPSWGWEIWHKYWVEERIRFYENIGLPRESLHEYWQKPDELAHYAKATVDILFAFPFGTEELEGIAARGDFDLTQHARFSGKAMDYFDEGVRDAWKKLDDPRKAQLRTAFIERKQNALLKKNLSAEDARKEAEAEANAFFDKLAKGLYTPHVIEPSAGADRLALALLSNAYNEEEVTDEKGAKETRIVMKFHPRIAPIKVGVFPLLKNRPELVQKAKEIRDLLRRHMTVFYDDAGAIGRRYRRQDEAGTPFGVTIDFDTLGEKPELKDTVTLRDRDTMKQERMNIQGPASVPALENPLMKKSAENTNAAALPMKKRVARWCISIFILVHLYIMCFWGLPASGFRGYMTAPVNEYVIKAGLWHSWDMFSPDPLSVIYRVHAQIHYRDGSINFWEFPRMEKLGYLERAQKERWRKWRERIRQDIYSVGWDDAARYIARLHNNPTNPPKQIVLVREWDSIPPLQFKPGTFEYKSFQRMPKDYDYLKYSYRFRFYDVTPGDL